MSDAQNVLFLLMSFPDPRLDPNLYTDLVLEFQAKGHKVFVASLASSPTDRKFENLCNVETLRVWAGQYFNTNFLRKGLTLLNIPSAFNKEISKFWPKVKFDLIIYPTPPLTFYRVVKKLKRNSKTMSYLILRDIFPQNAKDLGLMRNNFLFRYFRGVEKNLYEISDFIGCMSPGNVDYIRTHNHIDGKKIDLLPNWKKIRSYKTIKSDKVSMVDKYNLRDKFVAIFGGVHGVAQELDFLLDLAEKAEELSDVRFLLLGAGTEKDKLIELAKKKNLANVIFLDRIPAREYIELANHAEIGLVNLNRRFTIPNIPSKTLDYFELKKPILAAIDKNTDYSKILEESGSGLWSYTGDIDSYWNNFLKLYRDKNLRLRMGKSGYEFLLDYLTVEKAYEKIVSHLKEALH